MGDEGETADIAWLSPRWVARQDQVNERNIARPGGGGLGGRVLEGDGPFGKVGLEEVDEVVEDLCGAFGARDTGYEDWREEGASVNVEVGTGGGKILQSRIRERGIC